MFLCFTFNMTCPTIIEKNLMSKSNFDIGQAYSGLNFQQKSEFRLLVQNWSE